MTKPTTGGTMLDAEYHCDEHQHSGKMYSTGKAAACVELRSVDSEDNEVPRGSVGEIVVRGPVRGHRHPTHFSLKRVADQACSPPHSEALRTPTTP